MEIRALQCIFSATWSTRTFFPAIATVVVVAPVSGDNRRQSDDVDNNNINIQS